VARAMRYVVNVRGRELGVEVKPLSDGRLRVTVEGSSGPPLDVTLFGGSELVAAIGHHVLELRANGAEVMVGAERQPVRVESRERRERSPGATRASTR